MLSHFGPLAKRALEDNHDAFKDIDFPKWTWAVVLANVILFFPVIVLTSYTIEKVIPTIAILEDDKPQPPAYEPIDTTDDDATPKNKSASATAPAIPFAEINYKPVTSSFRDTWRAVKGQNGFRAIFRGLACYFFYGLFTSFGSVVLGFFLMAPMKLAMMLLFCQFSTAWVHIIMTPSSSAHFWRRLPPFRQTLRTTWRPITILWATILVAHYVPVLLLSGAGQLKGKEAVWNAGLYISLLFSLLISVFGVVPAFVVLLRVQASLLPEGEETIVPFDRTFDGRALPSELGGQSFLSVKDAWATFSGSAWRRLIVIYVKSFFASFAVNFCMFIFIIPQMFLVASAIKKNKQDGAPQGQ